MSLEARIIALATAIGTDIKSLNTNQGNLADLSTSAKNTLVAAINELKSNEGDLASLSTTAKGNIVAALNEVAGKIGTLSSLNTTAKTDIVSAINEIVAQVQAGAGTYTNAIAVPTTIGGITAGSTFNAKSWQQMFDSLLYPYQVPAFSAFSFTGASTPLEVGASIAANRTFTWTSTNSANINVNSINIEYPVGNPIATGLANDGTETVTHSAVQLSAPGTATFRVRGVNTQAGAFTRDLTIEWRWLKFSGNSALAGPLSAAQIQALGTSSLATDDAGNYVFGAAAGTYKYIACPVSWGTLTTFKDQSTNLDVPMQAAYTVSVTNANGQTTNYNVYRTTNQLGGAITIVAS